MRDAVRMQVYSNVGQKSKGARKRPAHSASFTVYLAVTLSAPVFYLRRLTRTFIHSTSHGGAGTSPLAAVNNMLRTSPFTRDAQNAIVNLRRRSWRCEMV